MSKKHLNTITMIMFAVSLIITATMSTFTVLVAITSKAIPPVIALLLVTALFVWIDIFYLNCYKWLDSKITDEKIIRKLKTKNIVLMVMMSVISSSMCFVLIGSIVLYQVFFEFQLYFGGVALVTAAYAINSLFIEKALASRCF